MSWTSVVADSTADLADVAFTEIWNTIVSSVPSRMPPDTLGRMEKHDGINGNGPESAPHSKDWKMVDRCINHRRPRCIGATLLENEEVIVITHGEH